ncbi:hypothetical protein EDL99_02900 [Ornithobacterium rhinotracheale]|uniref:hypothetical protein n=1 Tax=Ornithobacterium rhinotracheale TaxID=28251 RepID=UPI00129D0629|nr:hypothetical protein [Ornithobacterium rhinotracheale]MRJ07835.1 hypothetical protein [Ornithobacterium rhinotracheale]UOH78650.1 hypothetical protein MT996_04060 [Ornithobacterium rhinotracheale]
MEEIKSLKDLRRKKLELQQNLTRGLDNPMSNLSNLLGAFKNQRKTNKLNALALGSSSSKPQRNELIDEGAKTILTFIASAVVSRFKLGVIPKIIVTSGVALATPYVVDFVQKKIKNRKNKSN